MAAFELNIYGENDEILKTYSTDKVRWGVFVQAFDLQENLEGESARKQIEAINAFMLKIFPGITSAELENADVDDITNNFKQLLAKANSIGGNRKKN